MDIEHQLNKYFNIAELLGKLPNVPECIRYNLKIYQGKICKVHGHGFRRCSTFACIDCEIEYQKNYLQVYKAIKQLEKEGFASIKKKKGKLFISKRF